MSQPPVNPVLVCGSPHVMRIHTTRCINLTQVDWVNITNEALDRRIAKASIGFSSVYVMIAPATEIGEMHMYAKDRIFDSMRRVSQVNGRTEAQVSSEPPPTPFVFEQLPKMVADVFCNLDDPFKKIPTCSFGGAACAITTPVMSMRTIEDKDREVMRAYFGTPERKGRPILMGVSYFVRDALWKAFNIPVDMVTQVPMAYIDPHALGRWLGLDVAVHAFVPASPRSDQDATVYYNKSMYSVQHTMHVTEPWVGELLPPAAM